MKKEKSCGGIIINDNKILMVKHEKGHIGFPKGHTENNETEIETALREIKEETNIDVKLDETKRFTIYYSPKPNIQKEAVYFIGQPKTKNIKPQEGEIKEVFWVNIDKVNDLLEFDNIKELWKKALPKIKKS